MKTIRKLVSLACVPALLLSVLVSCKGQWSELRKETPQKELPVIEIVTENHTPVTDRETYLPMTVSVRGCENESYNVQGRTGRIRGRGNSSWDFCEKKSYRLKFDEKIRLLGAGKGADKDWALISNAREKSMLRNYAALLLAKKMGVRAVCDCTFAVLYLNGEYLGVYLLSETVELGKNRLDLPAGSDEVDIPYLLELDRRAKSEAKSALEYFTVNDWAVPFAVKSDVTTREQRDFIRDYLCRTDDAILSGNREAIEALTDLPSMVDLYLIEEFTKDRDVGFASFFLYKPASEKLFFGFPWDFDMALGNDSGEDRLQEPDSPKIDYSGTTGLMAAVLNRWFAALIEEDWFRSLAAERLAALEDVFAEVIEETAKTGFSMVDEAERNYEKWRVMGKKQLFEPGRIVRITGYTGQVEYLLDWMQGRYAYLRSYFDRYLPEA